MSQRLPRRVRSRFARTVQALVCVNATIAAALLAACVTNSDTQRRQLIVVSDEQMNTMGADSYAEMKSQIPASNNESLAAKVQDIGERIAAAAKTGYDWEFTLFDSADVNAFCLPGGKVGVYTGIIPVTKNNAGLAAVMGHEVAHALLRHGAERVSQSLIVAGVLLTLDQAMEDSNRKKYILAGIGLGAQFGIVLPYGRTQESEADQVGLRLMAQAGYDPAESVGLWQRMAALGKNPPEWLSTHPDPSRRAQDLAAQVPNAQELRKRTVAISTENL